MTEISEPRCQNADERLYAAQSFPVTTQALITALLFLVLVAPLAPAQSRRDGKPDVAPPPVISQTIEMRHGAQVEVPLGVHGTRGEMLEFIIRTPPIRGHLSGMKNIAFDKATVIYTAPARSKEDGDSFVYAVRSSTGVSAPGVITIRFVEPRVAPAKLKAPFDVDFPPVFPGQRSTAELEVANEGGAMLEGEVTVPEPWSIEGVKIFRIGGGQHTFFKLVITPTKAGVQTGEAVISGTERKVIPLRVSAEDRFILTPVKLKLAAQPGSQTRMGVLQILNRSGEEESVTVEVSARLMTDHIIRIPAYGTAAVPVFADAAESASFEDAVKLICNEWSASVPVHAIPVGPILKFAAGELIITGSTGRAVPSGVSILENTGGEAVTVRLDVGHPFEVENRVATAPARGSVEIPVFVRDSGPGTFASSLKAIGEGGAATLALKAEIAEAPPERMLARPPNASALPAASTAPVPNEPQAAPAENMPRDNVLTPIPMNAREIPNALGKFACNIGVNSATLDWPVSLGAGNNAHIEERVLSLSEDGKLQIGWSPLDEVKIAPAPGRVIAELHGLRPGTYYAVRVVAGNGEDASVLFTSDFRTVPKKPIFTAAWRTPMLVITLAVLAFAVWRSRRTPQKMRMKL
jgi:hypothetical protein